MSEFMELNKTSDELAETMQLIAQNKATDNLSVEELEKASEPVDPLESKDVQIAAGQYAHMVKQIKGRAKNMKAGALARVLIATAEFPYAESYPKFRSPAETDLFVLMLTNGKAKGIISEALKSQQSVLENIAVEKVTESILKPLTKEEKPNGNMDQSGNTEKV